MARSHRVRLDGDECERQKERRIDAPIGERRRAQRVRQTRVIVQLLANVMLVREAVEDGADELCDDAGAAHVQCDVVRPCGRIIVLISIKIIAFLLKYTVRYII